MKFLSLYRTTETGLPPTPEEMSRMGKLVEEGMKAGYLLAVEGCMPSAAGARVRLAEGKLSVTDGPFTESKEVIGGLAILQADSRRPSSWSDNSSTRLRMASASFANCSSRTGLRMPRSRRNAELDS